MRGRSARYDAPGGVLEIEDAEFNLYTLSSRGAARSLRIDQADRLTLTDVSYTTCARGKDDWMLRAGTLGINRRTGMATARNARLDFMGVPILYAPWLTYPVTNQRKTGLLLPNIGRSQTRGIDLEVPWYLNLAPNHDATFTPRYMSRRGVQAKGEFRYLTVHSRGTLSGEYLPDDEVTDARRSVWAWYNRTALPFGGRATVDVTDVSDTTYFQDFAGGLGQTSQTHLPRRLDIEFADMAWAVMLRMEEYETLDESLLPAEKPYQRLPQLSARTEVPGGPLGLTWRVDSEATWFNRDVGVTGLRAHLMPEIELPLDVAGFYLEPAVAFDVTRYWLDDTAPGDDDSPGRSLPVWRVNFGTVLERMWGNGDGWLQTVEPRLQFVHVPFEDQSDLPVFDTILPDFNMVQLFRSNRFVGLDRLGDTDRLNIGVTTRLIDAASGSQRLSATIGETRYFSNRTVTLPGQPSQDDNSSDYIAELGLNIRNVWNVDIGWQWDSDESVTRLAEARVLWRPDPERVLNLSYRFRRDSIEEVDLAFAWPLGNRWSAIGRYDYSIEESEPLDRFIGFEYSTCCWGLRLVARRQLVSRSGESDTTISLQLQLKGFSSHGRTAEQMLERGILGYHRFDNY